MFFSVSVPVSSSGLETSAGSCPRHMGGKKKTQKTHYHVVRILSCLGGPPCLHLQVSPCACSLCYVQGFSVGLKKEGHSIHLG